MGEQPPATKAGRKLWYIVAGAVLLLAVIGIGFWLWSEAAHQRWEAENKARWEAEEKKRQPGGSFDANDFDATARWLAGQHVTMKEAEDRRNEMATKEAKLTMLHTLASLEGKPVRWQVSVASVSGTRLHAESFFMFKNKGKEVNFHIYLGELVVDPKALVPRPSYSEGFTIGDGAAISKERASRLNAKDKVTVSGKINRCYAEYKHPWGWEFFLSIGDAKIE